MTISISTSMDLNSSVFTLRKSINSSGRIALWTLLTTIFGRTFLHWTTTSTIHTHEEVCAQPTTSHRHQLTVKSPGRNSPQPFCTALHWTFRQLSPLIWTRTRPKYTADPRGFPSQMHNHYKPWSSIGCELSIKGFLSSIWNLHASLHINDTDLLSFKNCLTSLTDHLASGGQDQ